MSLSKKMEGALNDQLILEDYASNLYLSMASWCESQTLDGCAEFMYRQADEERMHMLKIFHYINEVDGHALSPGIDQPPHNWPSVQEMFHEVYQHEQKVTSAINNLVEVALAEKDHSTYNFLQWYVDEQREEETLMRTILDRIKLIGDGPQSLYYIDKEVRTINAKAEKAESI
ncbi:MAG: ferritin [Bacteroidetes bacterium]|nr:ferritin [Bacteroidota bacterium]